MTEKELKKLSRLELLELLLEVSKENKKLKEEIKLLKIENKTTQNIDKLSEITGQIENALRYANNITDTLRTTSGAVASPGNKINKIGIKSDPLSDVEIYKRMLRFFAGNDNKLGMFPDDIANDVRARIKSIRERRKLN